MSNVEANRKGIFFTTNRLEALTDGVFAIVMTLLVLDLSTSLTIPNSFTNTFE
jgi:uncharacterized membrane protein